MGLDVERGHWILEHTVPKWSTPRQSLVKFLDLRLKPEENGVTQPRYLKKKICTNNFAASKNCFLNLNGAANCRQNAQIQVMYFPGALPEKSNRKWAFDKMIKDINIRTSVELWIYLLIELRLKCDKRGKYSINGYMLWKDRHSKPLKNNQD